MHTATGERERIVTLDSIGLAFAPEHPTGDAGTTAFVWIKDAFLLVDLAARRVVRTIPDRGHWVEWSAAAAGAPLAINSGGDTPTFAAIDPTTGMMRGEVRMPVGVKTFDYPHLAAGGRVWVFGDAAAAPPPWAVFDASTFAPVHIGGGRRP